MKKLEEYLTREGWKNDLKETRQDAIKSLDLIVNAIKWPTRIYKNNRLVNINANVLAAAYPSIEAAAQTSRCMKEYGCGDGAITTGAAAADWLAYIPVHIGLHYLSNRKKFSDEQGKLKKKEFWKDVEKVYWTQIPSIVLFYIMASPAQYALMKTGMDADSANRASFWGTLVVTRALHTYNYWKASKKNN